MSQQTGVETLKAEINTLKQILAKKEDQIYALQVDNDALKWKLKNVKAAEVGPNEDEQLVRCGRIRC